LKSPANVDATTDYVIHTVFMYLDTYGNEAINGWDGTSISISTDGDNANNYILAP
jgi:hypothetical protein